MARFFMYTLFILFSKIKGRYYVGFTGDSIGKEAGKHNSNYKGYTGNTGDWKFCLSEIFIEKT